MKLNEKEIFQYSAGIGDKDGRVNHKVLNSANTKESALKERWIKLRGNLLFYYKINEYGGLNGGVNGQLPAGFFILECCQVANEYNETLPSAFSIVFDSEPEKKHIFSCLNQSICDDWVQKLKEASYQTLLRNIRQLQETIIDKTGKDPLANCNFAQILTKQITS